MNNRTLPTSAALPAAHAVLQILIVVNWLAGAAIAVLLVAMPTSQWIRSALGIPASEEARGLIVGLHAVAVIGLAAVPLGLWRGSYQWLCAGVAAALTVTPGVVTLVLGERLAKSGYGEYVMDMAKSFRPRV